MRVPDAAVVASGVVAALLLVVLIRAALVRRAVLRRLARIAARLDGRPLAGGERHLDQALDHVEQASGRAVEQTGAAQATAERLRQTIDAIPHGVVVCDEQGSVVFRNDRAGGSVARHADVLAEQEIRRLLDTALAGGVETQTLEVYGPPRRTLTITGVPLDSGQRFVGAAVIVEDVSERRRLDAMRRDFVANISHELKTPVGALALLAETLAAESDRAVARRLASRIQAESFRVNRVIEDLLDLSRIEAEEAPRREPVPVHLVMAEAVERVRPAAELHRVVVVVDEPAADRTIRGDRRQLVSALFNLLENAVKYSDPGSRVELASTAEDGWVELVVRDHGIGIPARDIERIFERFYRVDRGRSRETGGTGLGLAIVRHVANNHGGQVRVQSREGEGSTFVLRLPAGRLAAAVAGPPGAPPEGEGIPRAG